VEAVIIDSQSKPAAHGYESLRISFRYKVDQIEYTSNRFRFDYNENIAPREIGEILHEYPVGKSVLAHYSPRNPRLAVLLPGVNRGSVAMFLMGLCISTLSLSGFLKANDLEIASKIGESFRLLLVRRPPEVSKLLLI